MDSISYWNATADRFTRGQEGPVEGTYDVAVVGGGFTGLSAARALAASGVRVVLLEAQHVGYGASGRNGGHVNSGIAHGYGAARKTLGVERARRLYQAFDASVDAVETVVREEQISCSFRRSGKLKLASKPSHVAGLRENFELINRDVDPDTAFLERADLEGEIGSDVFHGAMLSKRSAMMHMGQYVKGLADAAVRHGATIFEHAGVTARKKVGGTWHLTTDRGTVQAGQLIAATDAYTSGPFEYFRRRIVPVGAFIIATRPLTEAEIRATMPGNRTCVTTMNIGNFFRLSPDNRLIWGGRAKFSAVSNQETDARSGLILRKSLAETFPHLAKVDIDYCWGGLVGMTADRFPRAGEHEGVLYGMGYSGHGAQMSTYMGQILAQMALGKTGVNPMEGMAWNAVPLYSGKPWFMPMVGAWYQLKDRIS